MSFQDARAPVVAFRGVRSDDGSSSKDGGDAVFDGNNLSLLRAP